MTNTFGTPGLDRKISFGAASAMLVEKVRMSLAAPPRRIVDIGAGSGMHAQALAEAWPDARVDAYEPSPQMYEFLESNIAERPMKNLTIAQHTAATVARTAPQTYDAVLANLVGYFTGDIDGYIRDLAAMTRVGAGVVVCDFALPTGTEPAMRPFFEELFAAFFPKLTALRTQESLEGVMTAAGFTILGSETLPPATDVARLPEALLAERKRRYADLAERFGMPAEPMHKVSTLTWALRRLPS